MKSVGALNLRSLRSSWTSPAFAASNTFSPMSPCRGQSWWWDGASQVGDDATQKTSERRMVRQQLHASLPGSHPRATFAVLQAGLPVPPLTRSLTMSLGLH